MSKFHEAGAKTSGEAKMHALNTAAACVTRAGKMTKEAAALQRAAVERVLELKQAGAPQVAIDRADATAVVVRDAANAAKFETDAANRAFKTTSMLGRR